MAEGIKIIPWLKTAEPNVAVIMKIEVEGSTGDHVVDKVVA